MVKKYNSYHESTHLYFKEGIKRFDQYIEKNNLKSSKELFWDTSQFEYLFDNFLASVGVIDYPRKKYAYVNSHFEDMFEYSANDFKSQGIELVLQILQKEHRAIFINKIYSALFDVYCEHAKNDGNKKLKVTYCNQMKMKDGLYKWILHQLVVLETDTNGMPLYVLKIMTDIDHVKRDKALDFVISKKNNKGIYETILKKTFLPEIEESSVITEREREILQLVSQGLSAKQIANNLYISEHTVYTHKKNMLKKFNLNSSNELVKYASSQGLIA